jgi:LysM repeat protein
MQLESRINLEHYLQCKDGTIDTVKHGLASLEKVIEAEKNNIKVLPLLLISKSDCLVTLKDINRALLSLETALWYDPTCTIALLKAHKLYKPQLTQLIKQINDKNTKQLIKDVKRINDRLESIEMKLRAIYIEQLASIDFWASIDRSNAHIDTSNSDVLSTIDIKRTLAALSIHRYTIFTHNLLNTCELAVTPPSDRTYRRLSRLSDSDINYTIVNTSSTTFIASQALTALLAKGSNSTASRGIASFGKASNGTASNGTASNGTASYGTASYGRPYQGRLENGVLFPTFFPGYRLGDESKSYTTPEVVGALLDAIEAVRTAFPDTCDLFIGDFSVRGGGPIIHHPSHQNGRDVDMGMYAKGNRPLDTFVPMSEKNIDAPKTWCLIENLIRSQRVQYIFLDRRIQKVLYNYAVTKGYDQAYLDRVFGNVRGSLFQHVRNHFDHMHVRFFTPWSTIAAHIDGSEVEKGLVVQMAQQAYLPQKVNYYVNGSEKSLDDLARSFGVTVRDLCKWNSLSAFSTPSPGSCLVFYKRSFEPVLLARSLQPGFIALAPPIRMALIRSEGTPSKVTDITARPPEPKVQEKTVKRSEPAHAAERPAVYLAEKGETLASIAMRSKTDAQILCQLNGIKATTLLRAGQTMKIPGNMFIDTGNTAIDAPEKSSSSSAICFTSDPSQPNSLTTVYYTVGRGETLQTISRISGLPIPVLRQLNGLKRDSALKPNQKIKLIQANLPLKPSSFEKVKILADIPLMNLWPPENSPIGTKNSINKLTTSKDKALVIGLNYGSNTENKLTFAESDATHVANTFKNLDFDVKLLTGRMATRSNILSELMNIISTNAENGHFILYFAGHGLSDLKNNGFVMTFSVDGEDTVYLDEINYILSLYKGQSYVMYDTCFGTIPMYLNKSLTSFKTSEGSRIKTLLAAQFGDKAIESKKLKSGLATYALLEYMKNVDSNSGLSKAEILNGLFEYIPSRTAVLSQKMFNINQQPIVINGLPSS